MHNTIYVRLLDEGTGVYRPVLSKLINNNIYLIGQRQDNDEQWEFEPNEIVEVEEHYFKDGVRGLIAVKKHSHVVEKAQSDVTDVPLT